MSNFAPKRTDYDTGDTRWLRDALRAEQHDITIDGSLITSDAAGTLVKSGTHIGRVTATKLGGLYDDASETGGLDTSVGHLRNDLFVKPGERHLVAVVHGGTVDRRYLPAGTHDANAEADLTAVAYIN